MKIRTTLLSIPLLVGTAGITANRIEAMQEEPQETVTRSPFDVNLFRDGYEALKDSPFVCSSLALISLLGIGYDNKRGIRQKYDKYSTKLEKSLDFESYDKLKQEIKNNVGSKKLEDGTIILSPAYAKLKNDIMNNPHKVLDDGTIRQYGKTVTARTNRYMRYGGTSSKLEELRLPQKDITPDGNIIIYTTTLNDNDIKDKQGKYKSITLHDTGVPYRMYRAAQVVTPYGEIRPHSFGFENNKKEKGAITAGTIKLLPDGSIEVYKEPKIHSGCFEKPEFYSKKTIYYPDGRKELVETETYGSGNILKIINGNFEIPKSNFEVKGSGIKSDAIYQFGDVRENEHFMQQLQKIADVYHLETGKEATFWVNYHESVIDSVPATIFDKSYKKTVYGIIVHFDGDTLASGDDFRHITDEDFGASMNFFDADHYLDRKRSENLSDD